MAATDATLPPNITHHAVRFLPRKSRPLCRLPGSLSFADSSVLLGHAATVAAAQSLVLQCDIKPFLHRERKDPAESLLLNSSRACAALPVPVPHSCPLRPALFPSSVALQKFAAASGRSAALMRDPNYVCQDSTWLLMSQSAELRAQENQNWPDGVKVGDSNTSLSSSCTFNELGQSNGQRITTQNHQLQPSMPHDQNKQRQHAARDRCVHPQPLQQVQQPAQPRGTISPATCGSLPVSPATRERFWTIASNDNVTDAVQQYQQMLLQEQERRNRELRREK